MTSHIEGNDQDPKSTCYECHQTITTDPNTGAESGHAADCEWNT